MRRKRALHLQQHLPQLDEPVDVGVRKSSLCDAASLSHDIGTTLDQSC